MNGSKRPINPKSKLVSISFSHYCFIVRLLSRSGYEARRSIIVLLSIMGLRQRRSLRIPRKSSFCVH